METTPVQRRIRLIPVGLLLFVSVAGSFVYHQSTRKPMRTASPMTLREALWVIERDWSRFYSPGSPESRSVAQALAKADPSVAERKYESFVLYRRGLSDTDAANEPLLVIGFDPKTISQSESERIR